MTFYIVPICGFHPRMFDEISFITRKDLFTADISKVTIIYNSTEQYSAIYNTSLHCETSRKILANQC